MLHATAPIVRWPRLAGPPHGRLSSCPPRRAPAAAPPARAPRGVSQGHGPLAGGDGGRCRGPGHLVWARRPVGARGSPLWAGPGPRQDGAARGHSPKRHERCAPERRRAPWGAAPTGGTGGAQPADPQPGPAARAGAAAGLHGPAGRGGGTVPGSRGPAERRGRPGPAGPRGAAAQGGGTDARPDGHAAPGPRPGPAPSRPRQRPAWACGGARCHAGDPPRAAGPGWRGLLPPRHRRQGIGRATRRDRRPTAGACGAHMGLCGSRRAVSPPPAPGPARVRPCGEHTRAGPGVDPRGPPVGARRLLHGDTRHGRGEGPMPQRLWAQRGCAGRRTGHAGAPPDDASLPQPSPLRQGTRHRTEAFGPAPSRWMGPRLWLLPRRRGSAQVDVGGPSPAPVPHGRTPRGPPLLCLGRHEGPEMLRGHRAPYEHSLCLPAPWQETRKTGVGPSRGRPPQMARQTAHVARDGRRAA